MIEKVLANNGRFLISWGKTSEGECIQLSKSIYNVNNHNEILGVISAKISPNYITGLFPSYAYSEMYAIIDENHHIRYSSTFIKSEIADLLLTDAPRAGNSDYNRRIFYVVSLVSLFLILAICIANYTASSSLFHSTKTLVDNINDYTQNGCSIDHLIDQVYMTEIRKRDAELSALQAQINPHFLYNTLDSIKWLADKYDAEDIEQIAENLAAMMRSSLNHGSNIITIGNELQQFRAYMEIQKVRYGNRVDYNIDVPEDSLITGIIKELQSFNNVRNTSSYGVLTSSIAPSFLQVTRFILRKEKSIQTHRYRHLLTYSV